MVNLDRQTVECPCPGCGFYNSVFWRQVRVRGVIICRGCKANIQLDDHMNEYRKLSRKVYAVFTKLENALSSLGAVVKR